MLKHLKKSAICAIAGILLLGTSLTVAQATEEDNNGYSASNKYTFTRTHVDAPKAFWNYEKDQFELLATYPVYGSEGDYTESTLPIDYTVNWIGKGWRGNRPVHLYSIPNQNWASFLGKPGQLLYAAPQLAGDDNAPIWSGFGADSDIPVERLRDGEFSLNLIAVDGPGKVEYFISSATGDSVRRFFSSHDRNYRETLLELAQHTHNYTTFTKPGTYKITFQVYARDKAGNPIISKPQTQEWRVGGNDPRQDYTKDFRASFATAPSGKETTRTATPKLQIAPKNPETYQNPGDQYYTDFHFETGNPADKGVLVLTIDGYQLLQLPVENGIASGSEMLGDEISNYQAIFIPATNSPSPRWASAPFSYQRNQGAVEQRQETDSLGEPAPIEPAPVQPLQAIDLKDLRIDLSFTPIAGQTGKYNVKVVAKDPHFKGRIRGGFQETSQKSSYDCFFEIPLETGVAEQIMDLGYCEKNFHLKFDLKPYPSVNAYGLHYDKILDLTKGYAETLQLTSAPLNSVLPDYGNQDQNLGNEAESATESENTDTHLRLSRGHLDIAAIRGKTGLQVVIKDDTLEHSERNRIERQLAKTTLFVPLGARKTRNAEQGQPYLDFLGKVGDAFYLLPEVQDHQLLWPGFSTESLDYRQYPQGIDFKITPKQLPVRGRAVGFSVDPLATGDDRLKLFFDTEKPDVFTLHTDGPTHRHLNWVFTQPGTYKLQVELLHSGKLVATPQELTFQITEKTVGKVPELSDPNKLFSPDQKGTGENTNTSEVAKPDQSHTANKTAPGIAKAPPAPIVHTILPGNLPLATPGLIPGAPEAKPNRHLETSSSAQTLCEGVSIPATEHVLASSAGSTGLIATAKSLLGANGVALLLTSLGVLMFLSGLLLIFKKRHSSSTNH